MSDFPIHLSDGKNLTLPITVTQSNLDGLCALIHFCEGLQAAGKGAPTGTFELVMHYRNISSAVYNAKRKEDDSIRQLIVETLDKKVSNKSEELEAAIEKQKNILATSV